MGKLIAIAVRNLSRYKRRTALTASLIAIGVLAVVVFGAASGAFKQMMIGQMTDSMLGHLQVHTQGYVASIDNLPLTLNMTAGEAQRAVASLERLPDVEAYSPRLKFGGLFSNYVETTGIRLNGVDPDREFATVPLLSSRIKQGERTIRRGEIVVPELLAAGLKVAVGDTVVVIVTNKEGSVNAAPLRVGGVLESISGPGGRDGYLHIDDATALLRLEQPEVSEIAVRLKDFDRLHAVSQTLRRELVPGPAQGGPRMEVHTWEALSPFYNIAMMIDLLTASVKLGLIAIVLISVMNVMLMSVYERVREIGMLAAMGTLPGKILSMFVIEGLSLGVLGVVIGNLLAILAILALGAARIEFDFGRQTGLVLAPTLNLPEILTISGIVLAIAALGSAQPAFKASRMQPVDALRKG